MRIPVLVLACLSLACAPPLRAQTGGAVIGGALGGAAGLVGGGLLGAMATSSDCEEGNPDQCLGEAMPASSGARAPA